MGDLVSKFQKVPGSFGFSQTFLNEGYILVLTVVRLLYHHNKTYVARGFSTTVEARDRASYYFPKF